MTRHVKPKKIFKQIYYSRLVEYIVSLSVMLWQSLLLRAPDGITGGCGATICLRLYRKDLFSINLTEGWTQTLGLSSELSVDESELGWWWGVGMLLANKKM